MIDQFEVVNYRNLQGLTLERLARVNLVTGPNGVGKTSLAEAFWLFVGRHNPVNLWDRLVQRRDDPQYDPLENLRGLPVELAGIRSDGCSRVRFEFREYPTILAPPAEVPIQLNNGQRSSVDPRLLAGLGAGPARLIGKLNVTYTEDGESTRYEADAIGNALTVSLTTPNQLRPAPRAVLVGRGMPFPVHQGMVSLFSDIIMRREKESLLDILRLASPSLNDLHVLGQQNQPSLWADVGGKKLIRAESLGGGAVRLLNIVLSFYSAEGGVVVVDEIENGLHHSVLPDVWRKIMELGERLDVQSLMTTHSRECVLAAFEASGQDESGSQLALHRMSHHRGAIRSDMFDGETLGAALDLEFDIR